MQLCGRIIELNGCFIDSESYALQNPVRKWLSSGQEGLSGVIDIQFVQPTNILLV